jgi:hypothetical protein
MSHTPTTLPTITPKTTGILEIRLQDYEAETPVEDATVVAHVYLPTGRRVATSVEVPHVLSGAYELVIQPSWSTRDDATAIEGVFTVELQVTKDSVQTTHRARYRAVFED